MQAKVKAKAEKEEEKEKKRIAKEEAVSRPLLAP